MLAAAIFALVLAGSAGAAVAQPEADVTTNYTYQATIIWGLNDFGDLAGQYTMNGLPAHAMVYRNGRFE